MKKPFKNISSHGSALLLVLGCVALLTILVISFLATTATERSTATFYSRGISTSLLSEEVLNLVTAQIHQGTLSVDSTPGAGGAVVAWASQPGMLRMYNSAGAASSYYKLFSSDAMVGSGAYTAATDAKDIPPADWSKLSTVYTDLNAPINNVYPIVDNNNLVGGYVDPVSGTTGLETYGSTTNPSVEGFSINPGTTFSSSTNPVAMPVQWIYVLQDGTLTAPTSWVDGTDKVTISTATAANPIIGRIAFWTDDETSKVNINTASEGSFWDVPLADGAGERTLAYNLPVKGEYNRIPGHPATVSLSSLFKDIYTPSYPGALTFSPTYYPADMIPLQNLLALTPRILFGGSQFGTQPIALQKETAAAPSKSVITIDPNASPYSLANPPPLAPASVDNKANRLYSSVDELLYGTTTTSVTDRISNPPADTVTNPTAKVLTPAVIQRSRFFATAKSRAPEVTLFNTPRISMWPITWPWTAAQAEDSGTGVPDTTNSLQQNPYFTATHSPMLQSTEKLLAYCGTVGGWPYYIQRQNAYSAVHDWDMIQRNRELFTYLQNLTGKEIPGYGGNFSSKYNTDRDQILMEMIDFCRSGPNLNNNTTTTGANTVTNYDYAPVNNRLLTDYGSINAGTVVPLQPLNMGVKGAGRFITVKGVSLIFYATDRYKGDGVNVGPDVVTTEPITTTGTTNVYQRHFINYPGAAAATGNGFLATQSFGMQTTKIGMYVALDVVSTSPGYIEDTPCFIAKFVATGGGSGGLGAFTVGPARSGSAMTTQTLDFPDPTPANNQLFWTQNVDSGGSEGWLAGFSIARYLGGNYTTKSLTHGSYNPKRYPFFADPVNTDPNDTQFQFTGSDLALQIWSVDPASGVNLRPLNLVQTIELPFSSLSGVYPMPCVPVFNKTVEVATPSTPPGTLGVWPIWSSTAPYNTGMLTGVAQNSDKTTMPPPQAAPGLSAAIVTAANNVVPSTEIHGVATFVSGLSSNNGKRYYFSLTNNAPSNPLLSDPVTGGAYVFNYGDMRSLQARSQQSLSATAAWNIGSVGNWGYSMALLSQPVDTAISLILDPQKGAGGDVRILELTASVPNNGAAGGWFIPHYGVASLKNSQLPAGQNGIEALSLLPAGNEANTGYWEYEVMFGKAIYPYWGSTSGPETWSGQNTAPITGLTLPAAAPIRAGDFANGQGFVPDGAIIPKPDESNVSILNEPGDGALIVPYYSGYGYVTGFQPFFSPARQISGPIAFGVLPTGVKATAADIVDHPTEVSQNTWRTLAFEPNPSIPNLVAAPAGHLGLQSPPDYLLLDDFWMPVVEPYAISEPLSTAGKINMNYQIVPFSHITRRTGLYAAMKSDVITAITISAATPNENSYKNFDLSSPTGALNNWGFRYPVDIAHTLELLDYQSQQNNRLFLSPAEICSVYLVPQKDPVAAPYRLTPLPAMTGTPSSDLSTMQQWWQAYKTGALPAAGASTALTGVNGRQQPYAHLYSLLTTKSNTFQVHMRVQLLKKAVGYKGNAPTVYDETTGDRVVGEYRGSAIVERYVDPSDPNLAGIDFAVGAKAFGTPGQNTLDSYYKYRVTSVNAFTP